MLLLNHIITLSDYTSLVVKTVTQEKLIQEKKLSLYKENNKEKAFIDQIQAKFGRSVNNSDIKILNLWKIL